MKGSEILKAKSEPHQDHIDQVQRASETGECSHSLLGEQSLETLEGMSLNDAFQTVHKAYKFQAITPDLKAVLHWHIAHLEYGCGSGIDSVSLMHWDQDEE